jgi:hypothetical protein
MNKRRKFEIILPKRQLIMEAELLDDQAPETCDAVWKLLPIEEETYHTRRSAREIFIIIPPGDTIPAVENPKDVATLGEIHLYHFPANYRDAPLELVDRGIADYFHIGFFYGEAVPMGPMGRLVGSHFANIIANSHIFAREGEWIREQGKEKIILRKTEKAKYL